MCCEKRRRPLDAAAFLLQNCNIIGENEKRFVGTDKGARPYGCAPFRIGAFNFVAVYRLAGQSPAPTARLVMRS